MVVKTEALQKVVGGNKYANMEITTTILWPFLIWKLNINN